MHSTIEAAFLRVAVPCNGQTLLRSAAESVRRALPADARAYWSAAQIEAELVSQFPISDSPRGGVLLHFVFGRPK